MFKVGFMKAESPASAAFFPKLPSGTASDL